MLTKQRIQLKTFKSFEFYPVVYYPGSKKETKGNRATTINLNVGGQLFRMQEAKFKAGVLK
jgi:hypothetical protein